MSFAWSMLSGRRFRGSHVVGLAEDLRATLEEFGAPGDRAAEMLSVSDPQMQRDLTQRRLRRTVQHAARDTPYYRAWFEANGVNLAAVTLDSLAAVTPTPKTALRELPAAFVSDRARPVLATTTTGTTGTPTLVWFSQYELEVISGLNAVGLMLGGGLRPTHVWANCVSSRSIARVLMERAVPMAGAAFVQVGVVDPGTVLDRLTKPLHIPGKAPRVTHLNATASYLAALVQEAERGGRSARDFGLEEIRSGGEILTDALRVRAEETFGALVIDGYSMTEIVPVSGQVCSQRHLHIPPDQGHVEVLDPDSHVPAGPGAIGVLTVTPFAAYRDTTLLLRYLTGDLVRVLDGGRLECEMAGIPATSRVLGRLSAAAVTTRDVLDLLQAERELPLPTRFALEETARGPVLHAVASRVSRSLLARLEGRAGDLALPLNGIVLVGDDADLPAPCPVRADLREHSFEQRQLDGNAVMAGGS